MKRFLPVVLVVLFSLALASCANHYPYPPQERAQETWMGEMHTSPNLYQWMHGAHPWFLSGDPDSMAMQERRRAYDEGYKAMVIRVPDFTKIKSNGDFQVQIVGAFYHNSVHIYGPSQAVRQLKLHVYGDTLDLSQNENKQALGGMDKVIIRVGILSLNKLTQLGSGTIEGLHLHSSGLSIDSAGDGNIYLAGKLNLRSISSAGKGSINVFGARTSSLAIETTNSGAVNVGGHVGVQQIVHHGTSDINVVGATEAPLTIDADGSGKIVIDGNRINLKEVRARGKVRVYVYMVNSDSLHVRALDNAEVGVAPYASNLYVTTAGSSTFKGRDLCANNAFVRAYDSSHINVSASGKAFASATQRSSVYFYGTADQLSPYTSDSGVIIPLLPNGSRPCVPNQGRIDSYRKNVCARPRHHHYYHLYQGAG